MEQLLLLMPYIWGAIIIVTIVFELQTADIDAIWFSISAFICLIMVLIFPKTPVIIQLSVFVSITIVLLLTFGKLMKRKIRIKNISTNSDALIGKEILLLEDCDEFNKGSGTINGVIWTTLCQSGISFEKGEKAIISAIDGNKLIITRKDGE